MYRVTYFTLDGRVITQKTLSKGTKTAVFRALPKGTGNILVCKVTEFGSIITQDHYTLDPYSKKRIRW